MPTTLELSALAMFDACVNSDKGVIVRIQTHGERDVNTPTLRAKQILYRFRKEFANPDYTNIQIRLSPDDPDNELWLIKTPETLPDPKVHVIDIDELD